MSETTDTVPKLHPVTAPGPATTGNLWVPGDYAPFLAGGSAAKVASSRIAPLVAQAQGLAMVASIDDVVAIDGELYPFGKKRGGQYQRLRRSLTSAPVMLMPWASVASLATVDDEHAFPATKSLQYRPEQAETNDDGRPIKYEIVSGQESPIGVHPSTPAEWLLDESVPVLVAEGMLKALSAMTAMLLEAGVDPAALAARDDVHTARADLADMFASLDADARLLVLSIVGVHNWRTNAEEWASMTTRDRVFYLGIDGDVADKPQVWTATDRFFKFLLGRRAGSVLLLDLPDGPLPGEKVGIDDALASGGYTLAGFLAGARNELPPRPTDNDDVPGTYAFDPSFSFMQECFALPDGGGTQWREVLPLAGRVVSQDDSRAPTASEQATGLFDPRIRFQGGMTESTVQLELGWLTPDGEHRQAFVEGPSSFLNYNPDQWIRFGAKIPGDVLRLPCWPPKEKLGRAFLEAVKTHRSADTVVRTRWTRMGWVPLEGATVPAFVCGDQVVCDPDETDQVSSGVTDETLPGCSDFGLGDRDDDLVASWQDPAYRERLRADVEAVLDAYLVGRCNAEAVAEEDRAFGRAPTSAAPWTDAGVAATILACGLKPALPTPNRISVYCSGTAGSGKTWSVTAGIAFWARRPAAWTEKHLPGGAQDTAAANENSIAQAPAWVVDDFAPSQDARKASALAATMEQLVRDVHNGSAKRRMRSDGGVREVQNPHALVFITGEAEPQIQSIKERTIGLRLYTGVLAPSRIPTDHLVSLFEQDCVPARVTLGLVKYLRHQAKQAGWPALLGVLEDDRVLAVEQVSERLKAEVEAANTSRASQLVAPLLVTLQALSRMCDDLGVDPSLYAGLTDTVSPEGVGSAIIDMAAKGFMDSQESRLGPRFLRGLQQVLSAGRAHVLAAHADVAMAPGRNDFEAAQLGWQVTADRKAPQGDAIGWHCRGRDDEGRVVDYVLFNPDSAFRAVMRDAVNVLGAGYSANACWQAVFEAGLDCKHVARKSSRGRLAYRHQVRIHMPDDFDGSDNRISGVAIPLDVLVNGDLG